MPSEKKIIIPLFRKEFVNENYFLYYRVHLAFLKLLYIHIRFNTFN